MPERQKFGPYSKIAPESALIDVVEAWGSYRNIKKIFKPDITPLDAPELNRLGRLVKSDSPFYFIKAAPNSKAHINFSGLFQENKTPIASMNEHQLRKNIRCLGLSDPHSLLMHVHVTNRQPENNLTFDHQRSADVLIYSDFYNKLSAISFYQNKIKINIPGLRWAQIGNVPSPHRTTADEAFILRQAFDNGYLQLQRSPVKMY